MFRFADRNFLTRIALRRVKRQLKREGDREEDIATIDEALADDELLGVLGLEVQTRVLPDDEIMLADEDGPVIRFLKYFLENGDAILALIKKLIELFSATAAILMVALFVGALTAKTATADEFDCLASPMVDEFTALEATDAAVVSMGGGAGIAYLAPELTSTIDESKPPFAGEDEFAVLEVDHGVIEPPIEAETVTTVTTSMSGSMGHASGNCRTPVRTIIKAVRPRNVAGRIRGRVHARQNARGGRILFGGCGARG